MVFARRQSQSIRVLSSQAKIFGCKDFSVRHFIVEDHQRGIRRNDDLITQTDQHSRLEKGQVPWSIEILITILYLVMRTRRRYFWSSAMICTKYLSISFFIFTANPKKSVFWAVPVLQNKEPNCVEISSYLYIVISNRIMAPWQEMFSCVKITFRTSLHPNPPVFITWNYISKMPN